MAILTRKCIGEVFQEKLLFFADKLLKIAEKRILTLTPATVFFKYLFKI
jgi:hypothetical protein